MNNSATLANDRVNEIRIWGVDYQSRRENNMHLLSRLFKRHGSCSGAWKNTQCSSALLVLLAEPAPTILAACGGEQTSSDALEVQG